MAASLRYRNQLRELMMDQRASGVEEDEDETTATIALTLARCAIADGKRAAQESATATGVPEVLPPHLHAPLRSEFLISRQEKLWTVADRLEVESVSEGVRIDSAVIAAEETAAAAADSAAAGAQLTPRAAAIQQSHDEAMRALDLSLGLAPAPPFGPRPSELVRRPSCAAPSEWGADEEEDGALGAFSPAPSNASGSGEAASSRQRPGSETELGSQPQPTWAASDHHPVSPTILKVSLPEHDLTSQCSRPLPVSPLLLTPTGDVGMSGPSRGSLSLSRGSGLWAAQRLRISQSRERKPEVEVPLDGMLLVKRRPEPKGKWFRQVKVLQDAAGRPMPWNHPNNFAVQQSAGALVMHAFSAHAARRSARVLRTDDQAVHRMQKEQEAVLLMQLLFRMRRARTAADERRDDVFTEFNDEMTELARGAEDVGGDE
eukprot:TRINITY_DN33629_c0_g1_i1.p1 TRINITY_DN33629_c0_g1~~TRINITY_DN33629_c0_g1_i1.p1  ORF type:complete len:458 (+),score=102.12 TRINITY_DN33629_c0_g1_i1:79-1374(+)